MQTFLTTIINSRKLTQQLKNSKKIKKRHKVGKKGKLKKSFFFSFRGEPYFKGFGFSVYLSLHTNAKLYRWG